MTCDINRVNVSHEKDKILCSDKTPIEILVEVFKYCQDDFDVYDMKNTQPKLMQILQELCNNIPENVEELINNSQNLKEYFEKNKTEIRKHDVQLFYAILNFMDFLKHPVTV